MAAVTGAAELFAGNKRAEVADLGVRIAAVLRALSALRPSLVDEPAGITALIVDGLVIQALVIGLADVVVQSHPEEGGDEQLVAAIGAKLAEAIEFTRLLR